MKNVPKLRFKGFSSEWQAQKFGDIASKVGSGSTPRGGQEVYQTSGIPFIRSQNVNNDQLLLDDIVYISSEVNSQMKGSIVKPRDILLNITGASIGRSCVVPSNFLTGNVNQHVCIIRLKADFHPKFLQPYLSSSRGQKSIASTQVGSGREGLNFESIRSFLAFTPSNSEQTKIADFLTAVDDRISQLSQKCDGLAQYKRGVMQKIFSQELRFKDEKGRAFPAWEEKRLGDLGEFLRGGALSKSDLSLDGEFECIHYGELFTLYVEVIRSVRSKTNIIGATKSKYGDILMPSSDVTPSGLAKACCLLKSDVVIGGDINVIRVNSSVFPEFLSYLLNFEKEKIIQLVSGTTVKHIYIKDIKTIKLEIPKNLAEQEKVAGFLAAVDEKISQAQAQLDALKQYKQGLLQQMFV